MANGNIPDYSAPYFEERDRSLKRIDQQAAQAAAIAESLGYYTPELQQAVTQPLGQNPTLGESLFGAPVRGLGKLIGSEDLQNVGVAQPFDLGQAQPQIPPGTDPQMRQLLESIGIEMGMAPAQKQGVVSNMPTEVVGTPQLKTKVQHEREAERNKQLWQLIADKYQTEQERREVEAQIQQSQAAAEMNFQNSLWIKQKREAGPTPTEASLWKDSLVEINQQRAEQRLKPWTYYDIQKNMAQARRSPASKAAKVQWFELAQDYGYEGTPVDFERTMDQAKWDPQAVAHKIFYDRNSILPFMEGMVNEDKTPNVEAQREFINQMAMNLIDSMDQLNEKRRADGETPFWDDDSSKIPSQLKASGVTMGELQEFMREFNIPTIGQAIQMYMDVYNEQEAQRKK